MIARSETFAAAIVVTMVAMHASATADEPRSAASFTTAAVTGATIGRAGEPARTSHDGAPASVIGAPGTSAGDAQLKFFGFLEFDWDSRLGGVPGFGPLPHSPS